MVKRYRKHKVTRIWVAIDDEKNIWYGHTRPNMEAGLVRTEDTREMDILSDTTFFNPHTFIPKGTTLPIKVTVEVDQERIWNRIKKHEKEEEQND